MDLSVALDSGQSRLDAWLATQPGGAGLLIGGTGHLDLTPDEESRVAMQLERASFAAAPDQPITLITGVAPGADVLLVELLPALLARRGLRCRVVGLLPVLVDVLWEDWLAREPNRSEAARTLMRTRFDAALDRCDVLLPLWDEPPPRWDDLAVRQRQYRRLGALLAQSTDLLVAVLKPGRDPQPGNTAEVVAWRRSPADIPAPFAAAVRRPRSDMLLIDPSPAPANPADAAAVLQRARAALDQGNALACYDIVARAAEHGCASDELEYVSLLALANAGSTLAALQRLSRLPRALRSRSEDWLALEGRLYKDLALRGGPEASANFRRAAEAYLAAYGRTTGAFSGINAATTTLLGGDANAARVLAQQVLTDLDSPEAGTEQQRYYRNATEAEGALLLGDTERAERALRAADALLPGNINVRSRTLQQLRRVVAATGLSARTLDALTLPPVVYVPPPSGPSPAAPPAAAAVAYVGITVPRELEAAEALLDRGWRVHAVLAAPRPTMVSRWRTAHGAELSNRLARALDRVHDVSIAQGFLAQEDRWCDAYVASMTLGLSRLAAQRLGCQWQSLGPLPAPYAGAPSPVIGGNTAFARRFASVIFADFAGFSRLLDEDLPVFWGRFMRAIGEQLAAARGELLFRHTWGDALHLVTATARGAAQAACAIQDCLEELRPTLPGSLSKLELRLSAHYAPVFAGPDPVEGIETYFGTQLSFAARVEPVTPPGLIFVTEAFAAALVLEAPDAFVLEYAGEVVLAKAYGRSRLFSLRRGSRG